MKHLPRWIRASITKHFMDILGPSGIPVYVENQERGEVVKFFEIRTDGPRTKELTKGHHHLEIVVDVMCQTDDTESAYDLDKMVGLMYEAATAISIMKFGDGPDDDENAFVACLKLRKDLDKPLEIHQWGILDQETKTRNASVEAFYEMEL